jgi:hypothetical protein
MEKCLRSTHHPSLMLRHRWVVGSLWLAGLYFWSKSPMVMSTFICKDFARIASFPPHKAFCCLPVLVNVLGCLREVLSFWLCLTTHNNHHSSFHIPFPLCYATDITVVNSTQLILSHQKVTSTNHTLLINN